VAQIDQLLHYLKEQGGSDLHLASGVEPRTRVHGELRGVNGQPPLSNEALRKLLHEIASPDQWREYEETYDLDFAYGLEGTARFRANYFVQERSAGAVFRIIPEQIVPLEELDLPQAIEKFAHVREGLVLVTGPTGSGKSTTLAAIRQDADVILVGEMRDYETISLAITAAEMRMLVFGTLHTNGAVKTIDRIIDSFPADEQAQIRISLSESLAGVVSHLLLPTANGKGRCAVNEILFRTPALPNTIREANTSMLNSIIQSGKALGMQSMDDALFEFVEAGRISPQNAYLKATAKARFESLLPRD
jgi:twitching motility protein PilT